MATLIAFLLVVSAALLSLYVLVQGLNSRVDLVSVRNFFLLGLIVFQFTSAALTLYSGIWSDFPLSTPAASGLEFAILLWIFTVIFLFVYQRGWVSTTLARRTPIGRAAFGPSSLLTLAIVFLCVGIIFRHVLVYIPVVGVLTGITGEGILAVAAGLAAWAYFPRILNPIVAAIFGFVVLAALAASLHMTFGRRGVLGVAVAVVWGGYHGYWKHLGPKRVLVRLAVIGLAGAVFLSAVTAVRSGASRDKAFSSVFSEMATASIRSGLYDMASGQEAGLNSLWLIENYPESYEYNPLGTFVFFVVQPVPRVIWPGKPNSLGRIAVAQSGAGRQKSSNYSIGPGLIGHIVVDNPWLSLLPYAFGLAVFIRYLDTLVRLHPNNPFVVLPVGVALGQIIGLPRGDAGLFMFQAFASIVAAWVSVFLISKTIYLFGWRPNEEAEEFSDSLYSPQYDNGDWTDDWWDEQYDAWDADFDPGEQFDDHPYEEETSGSH